MHRHVEGVVVIEAHPVVQGCLAEGADWQRPAESGREERLQHGRAGSK